MTQATYENIIPELSPNPAHKQITAKELGELRSRHWTVRHGSVNACQHKLDGTRPPSNNCVDCWVAYFEVYTDLPKLHETLTGSGESAMVAKHGTKFTKHFKTYIIRKLSEITNEPATQEPPSGPGEVSTAQPQGEAVPEDNGAA